MGPESILTGRDNHSMLRVDRIDRLPDNFDEFVGEIGEGLEGLYGEAAATQYRELADRAVLATIEQPRVDAIVARSGGEVAGMLFAPCQGTTGQISFIHVLRRYAGQGVEQELVEESVRTLRAGGVDAVVSECVPFCALDVAATYCELGFDHVERALMAAPLEAPGLNQPAEPKGRAVTETQYAEAAAVIVDAYRGHPGRRLHTEVLSQTDAADFLERVALGYFGAFEPDYVRAIEVEGRAVGVVVGCQIAPEHGFVLQLAVCRDHQRRGLGTRLINDLAREFRAAGLSHAALGVTVASPALRLYERLGFVLLRPVDTYVWWRP